ncbi:MAG: patatin-like phospholipase family protein [Thiolinea sp.]
MDTHDHISVIEALSCLGDLPLNHLSVLIPLLKSKHVPARQTLFEQGDTAEQVYFIGSGRLAQYQDERFCGRLSRGQIAGWDSFFHRCPREHTLVAENDCFVYTLKREDMDSLIRKHPEVLSGFLMAATPVPVTGKPVAPVQVNKRIGVFTFADLKAEAEQVFKRLLAGDSKHHQVATYSCAAFCDLAGVKADSNDLFGHLAADMFAHLESESDSVFYTATADDPRQWLEKISSQVDTLILVVKDTTDTLPAWFEAFLHSWEKKPGLVILTSATDDFSRRSLALWEVFEPEWHYRLHIDDMKRWESVTRMALGKAVNLVLSGGGCLGAIHCGILRALVEADFPIDTIGGTSAGAGIAISHALGNSPVETAEKFRYAFMEKKPFKAYTIPFYSLLNPRRLDNVLREIAAGFRLEESLIPVHATVTNLTRSQAEVITTGPAWEAMRMTGSLPGIIPPYIKDGCAYIDGGVVNNFPVSVARQRYNGHYVGVTFNIPKDDLIKSRYEDLPGTLQSVLEKLRLSKTGDFPRLGAVLTNSLVLSSSSGLKDAVNRVDLLLHPPVPQNVGITSFERFDELYAIGVEYGKAYLSNLKSPLFSMD